MITGFNTDVRHNDKVYHVQTEDKGMTTAKIETLVYVGGEILDSFRSSYQDKSAEVSESEIMELLETQHKRVIRSIRLGKYDDATPFTDDSLTGVSLDELIVKYLEDNKPEEKLKLVVNGMANLLRGQVSVVQAETKKAEGGEPLAGVWIRVKVLFPKRKSTLLVQGETDREGRCSLRTSLKPGSRECIVVVQAISELGVTEQRFNTRA